MWLKIPAKLFPTFIFGSLVVLVYLMPNLWHWSRGESGTVLLRDDEFSYAARILRVEQGYLQVGNEWSWENRHDPNLVPTLPDMILALLSKFLPVSFEIQILLLRALLVLLLFLALRGLIGEFVTNYAAPAGLSAWILTDPGLLFYKPILATFLSSAMLPLNRFTNPLFGLTIFFVTMLLAFRAFSEQGQRKQAVGAGIFLAAQFYISVYYWTHTVLWILFVIAFSKNPKRWQQLAWGVGVTTILAIPYVLHSLELRQHPVFSTIAWRNGLLLKERGWYLLGHKTIYLFLALALWQMFRGDYRKKFLGIGIITGGIIYFSSLLTVITFQNFHWHYTLAPVAFLLAYLSLPARWAEQSFLLFCLGLLSLVCGGYSGVREYQRNLDQQKVGASLIGKGYEPALRWIRENTAPDAVILAAAPTAPHLPLKTERRVLYNSIVQFVSAQEVLLHHQLYWFLHGWHGDELVKKIQRTNPVLAQFEYGFTDQQEREFQEKNYPPISLTDMERLAREVAEIQSALSPHYFQEFLRRKKLDFILVGENEVGWKEHLPKLFLLEPVFQTEAATIFRVQGIR
jgi:hypothetical protein